MSGQEKPPEVYLRKVGLAYLKTLSQKPIDRLMLMILSASQSHPELLPILMGKLTEVIIFPLITYFTRQQAEGRLRSIPPVSAGQLFMGPLILRAIISKSLEDAIPFVLPDEEEFIDTHVRSFMDGNRAQ